MSIQKLFDAFIDRPLFYDDQYDESEQKPVSNDGNSNKNTHMSDAHKPVATKK